MPTSWAHGAKSPSRIDFMFASTRMVPLLANFHNEGFGQFDVHAALSATIRAAPPESVRELRSVRPYGLDPAQVGRAHLHMDAELMLHHESLQQAISAGDTSTFFEIWSKCIDLGLWQGAGASAEASSSLGFRGNPKISTAKPSFCQAS